MGISDLPLASGKDHQRAFEKLGWTLRRDGNHLVMTHPNHENTISIPNHKEVKRATLHAILRHIGISDAQYRTFFDT
jgi:predicted RNA binding protein YcfA (HicA-like mRNA interferase family)